ncbi:unnamed protein product [Rotaria sp. Silwood2]|nr:unnamed protein product [Rotaria sp. Silwood2]CAF2660422.1 unnamed protein product [Rotaria sp. Silwood2]
MILIGFLIFSLIASLTFSLPTCNLSMWINTKDFTCSGSPNTTYSAMNYNGNCTMFPNDPDWTTYKLIIDVKTQTVQNFVTYNFKNCYKGNELFFAKTPLSLDVCVPLYLVVDPSSSIPMGGLVFTCKD